jgi:uncharacterized protein (TIGR02678 family)
MTVLRSKPAGGDASAHSHIAAEQRAVARHLITQPFVRMETDPEMFRLIRRHEQLLDRWFTQRLGYRLLVTADSARLFKTTTVPRRRQLMTVSSQPRPFTRREYVMLALALAAIAAGPNVISLRDLLHEIRSAAADADISIVDDPSERRSLVTALRWMIAHGLVSEMHDRVDRYAGDESADAVLRLRPDRIALVSLPALTLAMTPDELIDRSEDRRNSRVWMRAQLVEEPVLYRSDLTDAEWGELRRRIGEETDVLFEMFELRLEARAEGLAAIDPSARLTDSRFPATGTTGHAALLLIDRLVADGSDTLAHGDVVQLVAELGAAHRRFWSQLADQPNALTDEVLGLLSDHRLVECVADDDGNELVRVLPAAFRFAVELSFTEGDNGAAEPDQASLW